MFGPHLASEEVARRRRVARHRGEAWHDSLVAAAGAMV